LLSQSRQQYHTRTLNWTYDGLDRLTEEQSVDAGNSAYNYTDDYQYDLDSNRVLETEDQGNTGSSTVTITSTYNADDDRRMEKGT
jgi:YD repeat-containing protein